METTTTATVKPSRAGDKIRALAAEMRAQSEADKKALARLVGAAAQIAQNCDRIIDEAARAAEDALDD